MKPGRRLPRTILGTRNEVNSSEEAGSTGSPCPPNVTRDLVSRTRLYRDPGGSLLGPLVVLLGAPPLPPGAEPGMLPVGTGPKPASEASSWDPAGPVGRETLSKIAVITWDDGIAGAIISRQPPYTGGDTEENRPGRGGGEGSQVLILFGAERESWGLAVVRKKSSHHALWTAMALSGKARSDLAESYPPGTWGSTSECGPSSFSENWSRRHPPSATVPHPPAPRPHAHSHRL